MAARRHNALRKSRALIEPQNHFCQAQERHSEAHPAEGDEGEAPLLADRPGRAGAIHAAEGGAPAGTNPPKPTRTRRGRR